MAFGAMIFTGITSSYEWDDDDGPKVLVWEMIATLVVATVGFFLWLHDGLIIVGGSIDVVIIGGVMFAFWYASRRRSQAYREANAYLFDIGKTTKKK